jgi:hypothetical protein
MSWKVLGESHRGILEATIKHLYQGLNFEYLITAISIGMLTSNIR